MERLRPSTGKLRISTSDATVRPMPVSYFGLQFPDGFTEMQATQVTLANYDDYIDWGLNVEREELFWRMAHEHWGQHALKQIHRNPWSEKMINEALSNKILTVSGCASSGKTTVFAMYALLMWACDPLHTKVILTSTSIKGARNRIWGQITELHRNAAHMVGGKIRRIKVPGKIVDSQGIIRLDQASDGVSASQMSTIELVAAEQSQEKDAVDKLIGIKNDKVIFILDEATDLSPSVLSAAFGNLSANRKFQIIGLANFKSIADPFGQLSTPVNGWGSVSVDTQEWETVYMGQRGKCIRFDGTLSPNVLHGSNIWPGLYSVEKYHQDKAMGENTMEYWRFCRSFVTPANVSDRVYSDADFVKGKSFERVLWKHTTNPIPVASLDPAFTSGGDRASAVFGLYGESIEGKMTLAITEVVRLKEDLTDANTPFDIQIARQWMLACQARGVTPANAAFDNTGSGISFGSILSQIWSPLVLGVCFGGSPTDRPVNEADPTLCKDAYMNRCAEIWFQGKEFVRSGQIRGLTTEIAEELVSRKRHEREKGAKSGVESKKDMKLRTGKSPDVADSFLILVDLLRERHGWTAGGHGSAMKQYHKEQDEFAKLADAVYDESALLVEAP